MDAETVEAIGKLLAYGAIGLGLALAIVAAAILLSGRPNRERTRAATSFMVFGFLVFAVGTSFEFYKLYTDYSKSQQILEISAQVPDRLWRDFLEAKESELFRDAAETGTEDDDTLPIGEDKTYELIVEGGHCIAYYVAAPPPSEVKVDISEDVQHTALTTMEFFKTGRICSVGDSPSSASVTVKLDGLEGSRGRLSFATFTLPSDDREPVRIERIAGTVCTGEFETGCTGDHDAFVACGASVDDEVRAKMCPGEFKLRSVSSVGGNRCGYGLIEVTCIEIGTTAG